MSESQRKRLSLDDILDAVTEIAEDQEAGPDRFRALKMLTSMNSGTVVLPALADDADAIDRLSRLIKGCGPTLTKMAWRKAFPYTAWRKNDKDRVYEDDIKLDPETMEKVIRLKTLPMLYKAFPDLKRPGVPIGYPTSRGESAKIEWIQRKAKEILRDRKDQEMKQARKELAEPDAPVQFDLPSQAPDHAVGQTPAETASQD